MTLHKYFIWTIVIGFLATFSATGVLAQDTEADGDPAEETDEASEATPAEDVAVLPPAPDVLPLEEGEEEDGHYPRFRWGIHGFGGPMLGGVRGGAGGMDARFGVQIKNFVGVYAQPIMIVGAGASADVDNVSATGLFLGGVGVLAEFDFLDMIYVGLGPELMGGGVGEVDESSASASTGPYFSIATRAGLAFGSKKPERNSMFSFGLNMHVVFYDNGVAVFPMISLGYDRF